MHTYFFSSIIYLFFWDWVQHSPRGLGLTQPARPGHWPKPVTRQFSPASHLIKSPMHSVGELFCRAGDTCLGAE